MKGNTKLNSVIRKRKKRIKEKKFILKDLRAILIEEVNKQLAKKATRKRASSSTSRKSKKRQIMSGSDEDEEEDMKEENDDIEAHEMEDCIEILTLLLLAGIYQCLCVITSRPTLLINVH